MSGSAYESYGTSLHPHRRSGGGLGSRRINVCLAAAYFTGADVDGL